MKRAYGNSDFIKYHTTINRHEQTLSAPLQDTVSTCVPVNITRKIPRFFRCVRWLQFGYFILKILVNSDISYVAESFGSPNTHSIAYPYIRFGFCISNTNFSPVESETGAIDSLRTSKSFVILVCKLQ